MNDESFITGSYGGNFGGGVALTKSVLKMHGRSYIFKNWATKGGGGVRVFTDATLVMTNDTAVYENWCYSFGAGVFANNARLVRLQGSAQVRGNVCRNSQTQCLGGGMSLKYSWLEMRGNSSIRGNSASLGGGVRANVGGHVDIGGSSSISYNNASISGGGAWVATDSNITSWGSPVIESNRAGETGGGLFLVVAEAYLAGITFRSNYAAQKGGGAHVLARSIARFTNAFFDGDRSEEGGCVATGDSNVTFIDSRFQGCRAQLGGGALATSAGDVELRRTNFTNSYVNYYAERCFALATYAGNGMEGVRALICQGSHPEGCGEQPSLYNYTTTDNYAVLSVCLRVNRDYTLEFVGSPQDVSKAKETSWNFDGGTYSGNARDSAITLFSVIPERNAEPGGGAIHIQGAGMVIEDCKFLNSTAISGSGGAIYVTTSGIGASSMRVVRSTFGQSEASYYGAAIWSVLSELSVANTHFRTDQMLSAYSAVGISGGEMACVSGCPPGKYGNCKFMDGLNEGDKESCASCEINQCLSCPSGRYGILAGAVSKEGGCISCSEGKFTAVNGSIDCSECAKGSYVTINSDRSSGRGVSSEGTRCIACPAVSAFLPAFSSQRPPILTLPACDVASFDQ